MAAIRAGAAVAVLLGTSPLLTGCGGDGGSARHTVVYQATGSGPVDITYSLDTPDNQKKTVTGAASGWSKTVEVGSENYLFLTVSAGGTDIVDATVGCRVTVDGKEVDRKSTRRGDTPVVQCVANID
ncbi:hypothetical protein RKE29_29685 [Streptomyces sp. B1866]|uniref:hypothetical protein n=1 Tax=Streptomyces sp. B1866 TaxID=3075431 RepID=UPI002890AE2B|nr:hypothetical protein [Streptomyces sp. B1866]MDT3400722.1 hypothetical protein [Streptomyces sp. B1866]